MSNHIHFPTPNLSERMMRDQLGLSLAVLWSKRGTCARRKVGCVLVDAEGHVLSSGYNGPASGEVHCTSQPCPGAKCGPGEGLELCEAIHAEANALLICSDVRRIRTAYCTASPCLHCVKLLMNTGCRHIIFVEAYHHDELSRQRWVMSSRSRGEGLSRSYDRTWTQGVMP